MSRLSGRGVLVTRPAGRAEGLARALAAAGAVPVLFPTLEILSISDFSPRLTVASRSIVFNDLGVDMLVFVSPTAVEQGWPWLKAGLSPSLKVAAVGAATAARLEACGVREVMAPPDQSDSEALAALPALQAPALAGRHVLIVRGEGGRAWLGDTLRARGATVSYLECYRRQCPAADAGELLARWHSGGIAAVTVTSRQALDNLVALLPAEGRPLLRDTPLFASHARIAEHARDLGLRQVRATPAGDAAMVAELQRFFATVAQRPEPLPKTS